MEIIHIDNKTIILDGAHNGQKLHALHEALVARGTAKTAVVANDVTDAIKKLLVRPEETVIVTGSFYLVSAVREQLLDAA